jgi:hypothetical protein
MEGEEMVGTKLRLTSDGTPQGTRVVTEDGRLIKGVQTIDWHLEIGGFARCQIEVLAVPADVVGLAEEPEGSSLPADPTAEVELAEPQDAPDGPGFTPFEKHPVDVTDRRGREI